MSLLTPAIRVWVGAIVIYVGHSLTQRGPMDWAYKTMLTALAVATVLMTTRIFGRRAAGVLAGLPTISGPAYVWVALDQGSEFASRAAVGGIAACGLFALFSVAYERLGRRYGPIGTLLTSLSMVGALASLISASNLAVWFVLGYAVAMCVLALYVLPNPPATSNAPKPHRVDLVLTAFVAGITSAFVNAYADSLGEFWCGVVASLPIISASVAVHQHTTATQHDVQRFLRGYVLGLVSKAFFAAAFSVAILYNAIGAATVVALLACAGSVFAVKLALGATQR